jgi:hypothetical protein
LIPLAEFVVGDNPERGGRHAPEIRIERKMPRFTMFWDVSFEELVALQESIGTYIAGERLG